MQPFEQHRRAVRVGAQQRDCSPAAPVLQGEVLVLALLVGKAHLQHGRATTDCADGYDEGHEAVHHPAIGGELPLLEQVRDKPWQAIDPVSPEGSATGHPEHPVGEVHPYFLLLSLGPLVDNAAMKASWGTSTRPTIFIRFLPSFCFSSSLRLRVMSPP